MAQRLFTTLIFMTICIAPYLAAGPSRAQSVIADLSEHFVGITADFTGAKILFFGTVTGPGKLVVVISGPAKDITVGNKVQRVGIWINDENVTFKNTPSFYRVLSSEPLDEWLPLDTRETKQIGVEYLKLESTKAIGRAKAADYRAALVRNMQKKKILWQSGRPVETFGRRTVSRRYFPAV